MTCTELGQLLMGKKVPDMTTAERASVAAHFHECPRCHRILMIQSSLTMAFNPGLYDRIKKGLLPTMENDGRDPEFWTVIEAARKRKEARDGV